MSTRGLIGLVSEGKTVGLYNHFDSYLSGLGAKVLSWARTADFDTLGERIAALEVVDEEAQLTPEQWELLSSRLGVQKTSNSDWYNVLREVQGDIERTLVSGYYVDSFSFGYDSLFCEWAYVIDLDNQTFEVYEGFQKESTPTGKWANGEVGRTGYANVKLLRTWPLSGLPTMDEWQEFEDSVVSDDEE